MARLPSSLTGRQRSFLRALAHAVKPTVQIGRGGLTPGVITELTRALEDHELIKVKLDPDKAEQADELRNSIESGAECHVVQHIGHIFVVYRERPKDPKITLPSAKASAKKQRPKRSP